jgi:predicted amino acid dehydrogenase
MEQFAFIIHPMEVRRDVATKYPILKYFPESFVEWLMLHKSPVVSSHITGIESVADPQAEGWFIGCPLSPRQLLNLPVDMVYDRIAAAGKLAAEQGAKIVGLGALTAVAGDAGISVAKRLEGIINVTTGNSYTVYTAVEGLLRAAELMETDVPNAHCAIVGATGSIGAVCAKMLANQVAKITLIGRNTTKLNQLRDELAGSKCTVEVTTDTSAGLREADLVVAVSSAKDSIIFPQDLKSGAVVCDVARPRDVSADVVKERDDVLVIEGGVVEVPGDVDFHFSFGFPPKTAYACMSETMILALEGTYEPYTLGRDLTVEQVQHIGELAKKHGFKLAGFRSFEKAITEEDIARVRENAKRHKLESRV